jgi:hypothetical protein
VPDRRAYTQELERLQDTPAAPANVRPDNDSTVSALQHSTYLGVDSRIIFGRIVDCVAYAHMYKVQPERGGPPKLCAGCAGSNFQLFGATELNTYNVGSGVLFWSNPQASLGYILCGVPDFMFEAVAAMSDMIVQGSNVGLRVDGVHKAPFYLTGGGGLQDRSGGRPFDGLTVGEWGAMAETGLAFFLDPFLAYARVDEETGLFLFYHDQLARLAGHNLQLWSAFRHREELDDQNEPHGVDGWTHQMFEVKGAFFPGNDVSRDFSAAEVQVGENWYSATEPLDDEQVPFHRRRSFSGYLGQGGLELLCVPPEGIVSGHLNLLPEPLVYPGVYEQAVAVDGTLGVRSAKGVIISKRPIIPTPKQIALPQGREGDGPANYKFSGIYGNGPPHVVGDIRGPTAGEASQVRAAAAADYYDYLFNWTALHPFAYHDLDWYIPEEPALPGAAAMAAGVPPYGDLATLPYLPTPTPFTLNVDERYGDVVYFPNSSMIALLEDGGILLVDGWGSELLMSAGNIRLSCPGDVWQLPGRNANTWAGYDVIQRAHNEVNLTANQGNVRIKAEQSVLGLAGNGGCGGFLWESRAVQVGYQYDPHDPAVTGFVVRCPHSAVALMGHDMLLTTAYPHQGGHVVVDAGTEKVLLHGDLIEAYADSGIYLAPGNVPFEFWPEGANFGANLGVDGKLAVTECAMVGESVASPKLIGHLFDYNEAASTAVDLAVLAVQDRATESATYVLEAMADVKELDTVAPDFDQVQFELRDADEYLTEGLVVYEPRWHQVARLTGQALVYWVESPCTDDRGAESLPHPGLAVWKDVLAYSLQDLVLHDDWTGLAVGRGLAYEEAEYAAPLLVELDGNFPIITNPV